MSRLLGVRVFDFKLNISRRLFNLIERHLAFALDVFLDRALVFVEYSSASSDDGGARGDFAHRDLRRLDGGSKFGELKRRALLVRLEFILHSLNLRLHLRYGRIVRLRLIDQRLSKRFGVQSASFSRVDFVFA